MTETSEVLQPVIANRFRVTLEDYKMTRAVRRVEDFSTDPGSEFTIAFFESLDWSPAEHFKRGTQAEGSIEFFRGGATAGSGRNDDLVVRSFPFSAVVLERWTSPISYESTEPVETTVRFRAL